MSKFVKLLFVSIVLVLFSSSCNNETYTPKPREYFRIWMPEKSYKSYTNPNKFTCEIAGSSFVIKDTLNANFVNLYYPINDATLYLTYIPLNNNYYECLENVHELVYEHTVKADRIDELYFQNDSTNVLGILYDLKGNAATSLQFCATDSTEHFLRGVLYFNTRPNYDSLRPVINYIREDLSHLIESIEWE